MLTAAHYTHMQESSRSHAVFTIIVEHSLADEDGSGSTVTVGKLRLVDLAGSEKLIRILCFTMHELL